MDLLIRQLINGLNTGSIYALVAIGYTMVYGIIRLINFAHGEMIMIGGYIAFFLATLVPGMTLPFIIIISMSGGAVIGFLIEKIAYLKLRNAPKISALITAISMSLLLQNIALIAFSSNPRVMPALVDPTPIMWGDYAIPRLAVYTIIITIVLMLGLHLFIKYTKTGKAMRAVSQDYTASSAMGINVNLIVSITFAIGSALGALGGVFYSMSYLQVYPTMGAFPGLKAFVAAVFGGIGSLAGAMLGGFLIGITETFVKGYISSGYADAIVFLSLILILFLRPSGILGQHRKEKV